MQGGENMRKDRRECRRLDEVKITKVILTTLLRGEGTEKDPARYVYQYWDMEGKFLFELDDLDYLDNVNANASS